MLLPLLRQFAAIVARELAEHHAEDAAAQPGRLFFPKRVHQLAGREPDAPDGLSLEYLRLAVTRNTASGGNAAADTAVAALAARVSHEIGRAAVLERQLLDRLAEHE